MHDDLFANKDLRVVLDLALDYISYHCGNAEDFGNALKHLELDDDAIEVLKREYFDDEE